MIRGHNYRDKCLLIVVGKLVGKYVGVDKHAFNRHSDTCLDQHTAHLQDWILLPSVHSTVGTGGAWPMRILC